jgi:hypothetical protein
LIVPGGNRRFPGELTDFARIRDLRARKLLVFREPRTGLAHINLRVGRAANGTGKVAICPAFIGPIYVGRKVLRLGGRILANARFDPWKKLDFDS